MRKKQKRIVTGILLGILFFCCVGLTGNANAGNVDSGNANAGNADFGNTNFGSTNAGIDDSVTETQLDAFDFSELDAFLQGEDTTSATSFGDLVKAVLNQEDGWDKIQIARMIEQLLLGELQANKQQFIQILLLCIAFTVLQAFAAAFENIQVHTTCFYLFFLVLFALLMRSYMSIGDILTTGMMQLTSFMQALVPAFCMALVFSNAISTATVFQQIIVTVLFLVDEVLLRFVIPVIHIYVVTAMLNQMTGGVMISRITVLLKKGINWILRILVVIVAGINVIQTMIAPALDNLNTSAFTKALNMIPGIGAAGNALSGLILGSAVVIKNGIGVAALLLLVGLLVMPLLKIGCFALLYHGAGAALQPIVDGKVSGCVACVGEGAMLLFRVLLTTAMLFLVSIAIVTAAVR